MKIITWIAGLLALDSYADPIGDFAPLEVGNVWVYQGVNNYGSYPGLETWKRSIVSVEIVAKSMHGDTVSFDLSLKDSLYEIHTEYFNGKADTTGSGQYNKTMSVDSVASQSGTIREINGMMEKDGTGNGCSLCPTLFAAHTYESENLSDTIIGSVARKQKADTSRILSSSKITGYASGIGLIRYENRSNTPGYHSVQSLSILSFDGAPLALRPRPGRQAHRRGFIPGRRVIFFSYGKGIFDFAGRQIR